jgi:dsDNA-specific endonuclease/ATPase MutS2
MLNYQLNYFVRCLESAIRGYLTKVTFIHGVGDGVLKAKMQEILNKYDTVKTRDASLKNFGYGATEVLIWHSSFA